MKRNVIRTILALVMVLSICFATAIPATAGDDDGGRAAGFVSGAGKWTWDGGDYPEPFNLPWHGSFVIHAQEAHHGQPAKGFGYSTWIQDDLGIQMWILVRPVEVTVVSRGDGTNEAWVMNEIVACSEAGLVGTLNPVGWLDGGTPGRNGDYIFSALYPYDFFPGMTAEEVYQLGIDGYLPWLSPVTKGNIVVKP